VMAVHQLVGKQVEQGGYQQDETGFEFAGVEAGDGDRGGGDDGKDTGPENGPAVANVELVAVGLRSVHIEPPAFDPAVGGVDDPHGDTDQHRIMPVEGDAEFAREQLLPEHRDERGVERKRGGPLPPRRASRCGGRLHEDFIEAQDAADAKIGFASLRRGGGVR
jgi:hypothetical protein